MKSKLVLLLGALLLFLPDAFARKDKQDKETFQWRYEIEPVVGQAKQGSCMVKVWTYAKKMDKAVAQAQKNAVHGIIFKGYAASTDGTRLPGQKPLVTDYETEMENAAYFEDFERCFAQRVGKRGHYPGVECRFLIKDEYHEESNCFYFLCLCMDCRNVPSQETDYHGCTE